MLTMTKMMLDKVTGRWMTAVLDGEDAIDQVDVENRDDHVDHDEDDAAQGGEQVDDSCSKLELTTLPRDAIGI